MHPNVWQNGVIKKAWEAFAENHSDQAREFLSDIEFEKLDACTALDRGSFFVLQAKLYPGNQERTRELYELARAEYLQIGSLSNAARMLKDIAGEEFRNERMLSARNLLAQAKTEYAQTDDKIGLARVTADYGSACYILGEYDLALSAWEEALTMKEQYCDLEDIANTVLNIALYYEHKRDMTQAVYYHKRNLELREQHRKLIEESSGNHTYGSMIYTPYGYYRKYSVDKWRIAHSYVNYANTISALGDDDNAISYFGYALEIYREHNDVRGIGSCLLNMGSCYLEIGKYGQAEELIKQALVYSTDASNKYGIAKANRNMGVLHIRTGHYQIAKEYLTISLQLMMDIGSKSEAADVYGLLADVHFHLGDSVQTKICLREGLEVARRLGLAEEIIQMQILKAKIAAQKNTYKAIELYNEAYILATDRQLKPRVSEIHKELSTLYKIIGDTAQALSHYEQHIRLRDEMFTETTDMKMKNLQVLHEVERHRMEAEQFKQKMTALQHELEVKSRELTSFALRIVEKQEFLDMVMRGLEKIMDARPEEKNRITQDLMRTIQSGNTVSQDWEVFTEQFMSLHREFIEKLAEINPDFTPTEIKVIVLLRLSMSTKEIADLMHVTPRSIENHRNRIRKKLALPRSDNLVGKLLAI